MPKPVLERLASVFDLPWRRSLAPGEPAKILRRREHTRGHCDWGMQSFSPAPGLVAAVVTESRKPRAGFAPSLPHLA